jgi:tetratricopeptide (TPR) repeat protein
MRNPYIYTFSFFSLMLLLSCSSVDTVESIENYGKTIADLQSQIITYPSNAEAHRELGIIYYQLKRYNSADSLLARSISFEPDDAKSQFYHGMTLEALGKTERALSVYINYTDFSLLASYRSLMEGRYRELSSAIIHEQFQELLSQESQLSTNDASGGTIAVFPLSFSGGDQRYAPLGKGISELIIIDLGEVNTLKLVERIRMEALMSELDFGTSKNVDPATAPRLGKILRAAELVTGSYAVSSNESMRMDVQPMNITTGRDEQALAEDGTLKELFAMEKRIVFDLIRRLGITLTPLEKDRIERIPTENIQAFLLYCIGLDKEDEKDFRTALVYYDQASDLDPTFTLAKTKALAMESLVLAGGTTRNALMAAHRLDPPIVPDKGGGPDLVDMRLQNMGNNSGTTIIPGTESRSPAQDAVRGGAGILSLPAPPSPPN